MSEVISGIGVGSPISALLAAAIHAGAGALYFFYAFNRRMHRMVQGLDKLAALFGLAILTLALPAMLGWRLSREESLPFLARWAFPIFTGLIWLFGDINLALQRRNLRGAPPVEVSPSPRHGLDFLFHPITTLDLSRLTYELTWDGPDLTVVQITDLHLNENIPIGFYEQAIELANQVHPDLVLLSGDFVTHIHNIEAVPELLRPLRTTERVQAAGITPGKAVIASLGNHDYWAGAPAVREAVLEGGAMLVSGRWQEIHVEGQVVRLGGDDSPWGPALDFPVSTAGDSLTPTVENTASPLPEGEGKISLTPGAENANFPLTPAATNVAYPSPKGGGEGLAIILSHAPDNIYRLVKMPGCAAVFSGHVHGGQIRLPLPGGKAASTALIVPSAYGRRFDRGHFEFPSKTGRPVHLFVSAGVGAAEPPLRLYCPPEVVVVRFRKEQSQ